MSRLDDLTETLIRDPDFESHPGKIRQGVKIICDGVRDILPDGHPTNSFEECFSLIAEGKAIERALDLGVEFNAVGYSEMTSLGPTDITVKGNK